MHFEKFRDVLKRLETPFIIMYRNFKSSPYEIAKNGGFHQLMIEIIICAVSLRSLAETAAEV